jgi:hypothetical protein
MLLADNLENTGQVALSIDAYQHALEKWVYDTLGLLQTMFNFDAWKVALYGGTHKIIK